jgi:peptidoglycan-associated lipoprotein
MWKYMILLLVIPGLLVTVSCSKKAVKSEPVMTTPAADEVAAREAAEAAKQAEMERQKRLAEERLREQEMMEAKQAEQARMNAKERFLNDDVHFEFDSDTLSMDDQETLQDKAQWLMNNPNARVVIEGHCDERGTNAYNLALGDRRAISAKNFLVALGISPTRLTTISYGEERPLDPGHNEAAWAKNRRAHFVLQ